MFSSQAPRAKARPERPSAQVAEDLEPLAGLGVELRRLGPAVGVIQTAIPGVPAGGGENRPWTSSTSGRANGTTCAGVPAAAMRMSPGRRGRPPRRPESQIGTPCGRTRTATSRGRPVRGLSVKASRRPPAASLARSPGPNPGTSARSIHPAVRISSS
jgi:hypothetical protein